MTEVRISTDQTQLDVGAIHRFLSEESAWARGIPLALVRESINNSLNFGLFVGNQQAAYARVVTDHATFAYLLDVFVLREYRGKGLSRELMASVMAHPTIRKVRRVVLVSSTARGLYQKFGFVPLANPETFMEINVPNAYSEA
ncbi:MAG: GNAT family N-acetyltransferase [Ideonella sp.]|nr:GNAT family N-acetyltransferase [Ideonella sp.]